jgi:Ca2+:H+ antiporter
VAVVGLAKVESPAIESGVEAVGFPQSFVGVVIALLVLLPETISAVRSALRNHVQVSLNLAFGSAMASIGLTIPPSPSRRSGSKAPWSSVSGRRRSSCSC